MERLGIRQLARRAISAGEGTTKSEVRTKPACINRSNHEASLRHGEGITLHECPRRLQNPVGRDRR